MATKVELAELRRSSWWCSAHTHLHSSHPFQSFLAFFNRSWWPPRLSWRSSRRSSWWCSASCARRAWAGALRRQTRAATAWLRRSEAPAGEGGGWRKQGQPGRCGGMQLHLTAGGGGGQWWRRRQASVAWVECHLRRLALKAMYCCVASFEHPLLCTATSATPQNCTYTELHTHRASWHTSCVPVCHLYTARHLLISPSLRLLHAPPLINSLQVS